MKNYIKTILISIVCFYCYQIAYSHELVNDNARVNYNEGTDFSRAYHLGQLSYYGDCTYDSKYAIEHLEGNDIAIYYKISITRDLHLYVTGKIDNSSNIQMTIYDANQYYIYSTDYTTNDAFDFGTEELPVGDYYIRLCAYYSNNSTSDNIDISICGEKQRLKGVTRDNPIELGEFSTDFYTSNSHLINDYLDDEWVGIYFKATLLQPLAIHSFGMFGGENTQMTIWDENAYETVSIRGDDSNFSFETEELPKGVYYIGFFGYYSPDRPSSDKYNFMDLYITGVNKRNMTGSSLDNPFLVGSASKGFTVQWTGNMYNDYRQSDIFSFYSKFTLNEDDILHGYSVTLDNSKTKYTLYDGSKSIVFKSDYNSNSTIVNTPLLESGDYYLLAETDLSHYTPYNSNLNFTLQGSFLNDPEHIIEENYSKNRNYILTRTYTSADGKRYSPKIQYFDGLGRPNQSVEVGITPSRKDLVTLHEYDSFGRESNVWLPTIYDSKGAYIDPTMIKEAAKGTAVYNDQLPFSKPIYEASPLNRVLEQYGPGNDWQSKGKSVKTYYLTNKDGGGIEKNITMDEKDTQNGILSGVYPSCESITLKPGFQFKATEEKSLHLYTDPSLCQAPQTMARNLSATPILRDEFLICTNYVINNNLLAKNGSYNAGELYVTLMLDEDDNQSLEFKDKLGQVILTRQINNSEKYDTYYVYDDFGNLRYVLPPVAIDKLTKYADNDPIMKQYAYVYKYDSRNRCTWKKLPGVEPISYVYDKADRLIFSQDGEQKNKGEWAFSIPDVFGRTVVTGTCKTANTTNIIAGRFDEWIIKAEYTGATTYEGYDLKVGNSSFNAFSLEGVTIHSINYYDSYNFKQLANINDKALNFVSRGAEYDKRYGTDTSLVEAKGLLTGSIVAQFDNTATVNHLYSTMYYDNRGRLIQTQSTNHLGGKESEYVAYNFTGRPIKKMHVHTPDSKTITTEAYFYHYDHAGRLIGTYYKLDNARSILIAQNTYDELGRLKTNKKGNDTNDNLKTTYDYNIRSWTSKISSPLFTQNLYYNTAPSGSSVTPQYGGNVSAMSWKVENETERKYGFTYDGLSRLTHSAYDYKASGGKFSTAYAYDKHGNMTTHTQRGMKSRDDVNGSLVDNLAMSYNGNQLINVHNSGTGSLESTSAHFEDYSKDPGKTKVEYTYNANGALASDLNKGSVIKYNSLNLPTKLEISNTKVRGEINYTYSASGAKLRTVHKEDIGMTGMPVVGIAAYTTPEWSITTTDYVGNKVYEQVDNGERVLKRILIDGGYYDAVKKKYFYYLTDHLGNNRVVAEANGTVVQKTHYYPFGMAFAESTGEEQQPYKYNGKELDRRLQLNTYDYAARYMDPSIGRFTSVDPLAEKYYSISPYAYVANNPLKYVDYGGDSISVSPSITEDEALNTAFNAFANSKSGREFLANYASKGQSIAGYTFNRSGKYHKKGVNLNYTTERIGDYRGLADAKKTESGAELTVTLNNKVFVESQDNVTYLASYFGKVARIEAAMSRAITLFHESFMHVDLDTKDFLDDGEFNSSNIDPYYKKSPASQRHHHQMNDPSFQTALWPLGAYQGIVEANQILGTKYSSSSLQTMMWQYSGSLGGKYNK